ncbi:MAG: GAF domain-containing protein [Calditrichaeota bacterium]|nr:GAF domain-containing protein [Calditrichota bacterium]
MNDHTGSPAYDVGFSLSALLALEKILTRDEEFAVICGEYLQQLLGILLVGKGGILIYDPADNRLKLQVQSGINQKNFHLDMNQDTFETMLLLADQFYRFDNPPAQLAQFISQNREALTQIDAHIWVPLWMKNSLFGFLSLGKKFQDKVYSERDMKILEISAHTLALAFHNQIMLEGMKKQHRDHTLLTREIQAFQAMSFVIGAVPGLKELTEVILSQALKLLQVRSGAFYLMQPHNPLLKLAAQTGLDSAEVNATHLSKSNRPLAGCFAGEKGAILNHYEDRRLKKIFNSSHLLAAPVMVGENVFGVIILADRQPGFEDSPYKELDLQLLGLFTRQAGLVIDNFGAFRKLKRSEKRYRNILKSLSAGVMTTTAVGEVASVNEAMGRLLKKSPAAILNQHYHTIFNEDPHILNLIQKVQSSESPHCEKHARCRAISNDTLVNISVAPLWNSSDKIEGVVITAEEVAGENKLKRLFEDRVSHDALETLPEKEQAAKLQGLRGRATILFCRIHNLNQLIDVLSPEDFFSRVNRFFERANQIILDAKGLWHRVDPEAMMAAYGMPFSWDDDAERTIQTAIELREVLPGITDAEGGELQLAFGIATGEVIGGSTGIENRGSYHILGEAVQIGRHLCDMAKADEILVCPSTRGKLQKRFHFDKLKRTRVKSLGTQLEVYRFADVR